MAAAKTGERTATVPVASAVPVPVLAVLRGIGQVFFQENALTGAIFLVGLVVSSPLMALGGLVGAAIGTATAWGVGFDEDEVAAGLYGFNSTLVGIATFFFFQPGATSIGLMVAACIAASLLTRLLRAQAPFPTYTAPFVTTTWVVFLLGRALEVAGADAGEPLLRNLAAGPLVEATAHGIGQVMFQDSVWTGLLFLAGIAVNDREHAAWVVVASVLGMVVASYHLTTGAQALDPERLVMRAQFENVALGLYGYNATLVAVALFLWRRSFIAPLLGIVLSVPVTELVPLLGVPALTAPFVLTTWLVLAIAWLERQWLGEPAA